MPLISLSLSLSLKTIESFAYISLELSNLMQT
jgi:hypothetical protein